MQSWLQTASNYPDLPGHPGQVLSGSVTENMVQIKMIWLDQFWMNFGSGGPFLAESNGPVRPILKTKSGLV